MKYVIFYKFVLEDPNCKSENASMTGRRTFSMSRSAQNLASPYQKSVGGLSSSSQSLQLGKTSSSPNNTNPYTKECCQKMSKYFHIPKYFFSTVI